MPRPVYIICAESGSVDAATNIVSWFNVIERFEMTIEPEKKPEGVSVSARKPVVPVLTYRIGAVWMREESDPLGEEFEEQIAIFLPDNKEIVLHERRFAFPEAERPLHRTLILTNLPPFKIPGVFRVESRVRMIGQNDWIKQDYPIMVAVNGPKETSEKSETKVD